MNKTAEKKKHTERNMEWTFLPFESFEIMSVLKFLTSNRYKSWSWKGNRLRKLCKTGPTMNTVIAAKTAEPHPKNLKLSILWHRKLFLLFLTYFLISNRLSIGGWGRGRSAGVNRGMQFC